MEFREWIGFHLTFHGQLIGRKKWLAFLVNGAWFCLQGQLQDDFVFAYFH
jgi:hypothetical protein